MRHSPAPLLHPPPHTTTPCTPPKGPTGRKQCLACDASSVGGVIPVREYQPVHPFDYACRPRLRTRLTQGGLA